jgi:type II secretory pathway pseudopilin PulG
VNFYNSQAHKKGKRIGGFTLVEAIIGISVLGLGIASTVGALTKFNALASTSRNGTGAYTALMNQVDLIQSLSPFNPQKMNDRADCDNIIHTQIPRDYCNTPPTYDLTVGTHTYNNIPVYQDPNSGVIVTGTMTVVVTDISATIANTYRFQITINYTYLTRNYSLSMSTIRTSDI